MKYTYKDVPRDTELWCCAYETNSKKEDFALKCLPCRCKVTKISWRESCYKLNKKGEIVNSSSVSIYSRVYADTYNEAVELYNELVQSRINWLNDLVVDVKEDFIK